ncbi:MAG TPA: molybdenum cofactor guanylyltransferase [Rhodothermales bacterium]|nr:molybdenum cofactor guanylyltransferase [Rhodothermales bacterium]
MPKAPDVTGLILAGGESRRFGSDKARHVVAGRPMIAHVYETLEPVVERVLVSVRTPGADTGLPVEHVCDRYPATGPLAGLHAGLLRCPTPWLLAVACDMPFLTEDVLRTLLAARLNADGPVVARGPDGHLHPLCALYPRDVIGEVEAALNAQRHALHALLSRTAPVTEIPVPADPLRNVNQPQDLR